MAKTASCYDTRCYIDWNYAITPNMDAKHMTVTTN